MTDARAALLSLAERTASAYQSHTAPRAILLAGSLARGDSDAYSDIDLVAYYDALPDDEQLAAAREEIGAAGFMPLGPRTPAAVAEAYQVEGVDCQCAHVLVDEAEEELARALERADIDDMLQKQLLGLLEGRPLSGADLIAGWQARLAAYPEPLARAMVSHHLGQLVPIWYLQDYLTRRDAVIWEQQMLVEAAQHLLGVLAGLNRHYYSTFQFKGLRRLTNDFQLAPDNLAERVGRLFTLAWPAAVAELETLVGETLSLLDEHLPGVETKRTREQIGIRKRRWGDGPA